jgi:glycosyltransferase involved in cell wall biosynthesis
LKKIVILTQYFPPETGAPQNRLFSLAKYLHEQGIDVSVLTGMPSYPMSKIFTKYKDRYFLSENIQGIKVYRSWLFVKNSSNFLYRLFNYFSFVFSSLLMGIKIIKSDTDLIICESPPLFLGITGLLLKKIKKTKLLFNVSDLWPKTAEELGIIRNKSIIKISTILEEYIYNNSDLISGQTMGIVSNISQRVNKKVYWFKNGYDFNLKINFKNYKWRQSNGFKNSDFLIIYAGILGHAQGLDTCLKAAKILKEKNKIHFLIFGSGPEQKSLIEFKDNNDLNNVKFFGHVKKEELLSILPAIDLGLVPLKNLSIFKGAIPSKIFDILSHKKPLLLGVKGEAKQIFIDEANAGLYYEPENEEDLAEKIIVLNNNDNLVSELGRNGYNFIIGEFNRTKILSGFIKFIKEHI